MNDLLSAMQEDSVAAAIPSEENTKELARLVKMAQLMSASIVKLEEDLKDRAQIFRDLTENQIPKLMDSLGVTDLGLEDGLAVEVGNEYYASLSDGKAPGACAWLRANGHEGIIKNEIKVDLGAGDDVLAQEVIDFLQEKGIPAEPRETVHAGTLAAFVREQRTAGKDIPLPTLGAYEARVATIKLKGKKLKGKSKSK